ncbi:hypothetical protein [Chryseobacterium jejuense]|uniref:hypothetical protein n=1 Tax=Chryseobacterium jejuense TaxID=445960 RepID=UPI001AE6250A|nr:hypothetical protein [Chryseobacterium jejuense]MBP2615845.1 hypothetical protein [Chryseobacterium jejuense]
MKKLINIFYFSILISGVISCNGQENKKNIVTTITTEKTSSKNQAIPDLFDKKYFHGYQLSPDSDYPIYTYIDKDIGSLTVNFINKNIEKQKEWLQFDFTNGLDGGDDPDDKYFSDLDNIIKRKLEPNLKDYEIIAEYIPLKYLQKQTLDLIYPYIKTYYLYNKEKKEWQFIKEIKINDSSNEKNITTLLELNSMINLNQKDSSHIQNNTVTLPLKQYDGVWFSDCRSNLHVSLSSTITNAQFIIPERFAMNAQLKKIDTNKYELYFTDFPPIIPLPDNMEVWDNMDNKKPVGVIEFMGEGKLNLTWFGFYHKKLKKNIETENPFDSKHTTIELIKCSDK